MKSEHRRELQANELEKLTESIGKFFEKYGKYVLIGLVAAIGVGVGVYFLVTRGNKDLEQVAFRLASADSAGQYQDAAEMPEAAGTKLRPLARLKAAELRLQDGIRLYFTDKQAGLEELETARDEFKAVLEARELPNWAKERALYHRAVCLEALSDGKTKAAIAAYQELIDGFPDSLYREQAEQRIAALQENETRQFYAFLTAEDRKPADLDRPFDLGKGKLPPGHPPIRPGGPGDDRKVEPPVTLPTIPDRLQIDQDEGEKKSSGGQSPPFPKTSPPMKTPDGKPAKTAPKNGSPKTGISSPKGKAPDTSNPAPKSQ